MRHVAPTHVGMVGRYMFIESTVSVVQTFQLTFDFVVVVSAKCTIEK